MTCGLLPAHATQRMEPFLPDRDASRVPAAPPLGRLRRRAEFQRVARGRRKSFAAFTLQSAPRQSTPRPGALETAPCPRVGLTVTRKAGNAVERNRIRRRLREALRAASPLEAEGDCDYVLLARREALSRRFAELVDDLRNAFRADARGRREGRREPGRIIAKDKDRRT